MELLFTVPVGSTIASTILVVDCGDESCLILASAAEAVSVDEIEAGFVGAKYSLSVSLVGISSGPSTFWNIPPGPNPN